MPKTPTPRLRKRRRLSLADHFGRHERTVLVLQGGGALGAYQAGVYAALMEAGAQPDWIAGVSIGAINAALIAGNPAERRIERLREFWERVTANTPFLLPAGLDPLRPLTNRLAAGSVITLGVPGFFKPRMPPPFFAPDGSPEALSYYDTAPLRATLEELVDFELVNKKQVRLSLGSVNVRNGNSVYFDNANITIQPDHVLASGALPPGFPPVEVDGELYWDGGIVSNSPLWYVLDEDFRVDALIFQVDLFSARGEAPLNLEQVAERAKDIQYASKTRFNTNRVKELEELRAALGRVVTKLPASLRDDPDVKRLTTVCTRGAVSLVHFINRHNTRSSEFKDYEFSRATMLDLWDAGYHDVKRSMAHPDWNLATDVAEGISVYDLSR